jgi:hypothetical protein
MPVTVPYAIMKKLNLYVVSNRCVCNLGTDFIQETGLIFYGRSLTFLNNRKRKISVTVKVAIDEVYS